MMAWWEAVYNGGTTAYASSGDTSSMATAKHGLILEIERVTSVYTLRGLTVVDGVDGNELRRVGSEDPGLCGELNVGVSTWWKPAQISAGEGLGEVRGCCRREESSRDAPCERWRWQRRFQPVLVKMMAFVCFCEGNPKLIVGK